MNLSHITRRRVLGAALLAAAVPRLAPAQAFPTRPITLIVPFPAAGSTDAMNRIIADKLQGLLGQPVVLDFKPGAGGNLGTELAARAQPDGYTMVFVAMPQIISPAVYPRLGYNLLTDLRAVGSFLETTPVLVVHPQLGVRSVRELVELARAQPGRIEYGTGGNGTSAHLLGELFKRSAGVDLLHVPYRGAAQAVTDLLAGRVKVMYETPSSIVGHVRSGALQALAVLGPRRLAAMPEVPTAAEAGIPDVQLVQFASLMVPAATPDPVVQTLSAALKKVTEMPDVIERWAGLAAEPAFAPPAETMARIAAEVRRLGDIASAAQIKLD